MSLYILDMPGFAGITNGNLPAASSGQPSPLWHAMLNRDTVSEYLKPLVPLRTELNPSGKLSGKVKCVLFDIYGTLFISGSGDVGTAKSETRINTDLESLLLRYGIRERPQDLLRKLFRAIEERHQERKQHGVDYPEIEIDRIWAEILRLRDLDVVRDFAAQYDLIVNPVYPMPHLREALSACRSGGLEMGIISNAQFYTRSLFHWFLGTDPEAIGFRRDLLLYSYRFGYAKPSKHMFIEAVDRLGKMGIEPPGVLYLGNDMLNDVLPARAVGFQTALFAGDARSLRLRKEDPRCSGLSPNIVITDLIQLTDHLQL